MNRREALRTLAAGSAAGALAGGMAIMATPSATAEPISHGLAVAIERHRIAQAAADAAAAARQPYAWAEFKSANADDETRAKFWALDKAFDDACGPMFHALDAVAAVPIVTLADMRAKAVFLAEHMPGTCDHNETMAALIASMGGEDPASAPAPVADPMREAVEEYEAAYAVQREASDAEDWKACEAIYAERISPAEDAIERGLAVTTLAGAIAAVRYVATSGNRVEEGHAAALQAALAYFNGRA